MDPSPCLRNSVPGSQATKLFLFGRRLGVKEHQHVPGDWKPARMESDTSLSLLSTTSSFPLVGDRGASAEMSRLSEISTLSGFHGTQDLKALTDLQRVSTASTTAFSVESMSSSRISNSDCCFDTVTESILEENIKDLERSLERCRWDPREYENEELIQQSFSNYGQVDRVKHRQDGKMLAVKRMPIAWTRSCHGAFKRKYPTSLEQPWKDMAIVKILNDLKFPYAFQLHGIFRDEESMYMATSLASHGDLCSICQNGPSPGFAREEWICPLVIQGFSAVRHLHDLNIAHLDLSLENMLIDTSSGQLRVKLIDFSMAQVSRFCEPSSVGKVMYRAPEVIGTEVFDAFKADSFSLGVVVFTLASQDYPWRSTCDEDACPLFNVAQTQGLGRLAALRKARRCNGASLATVFSLPLFSLLSGLLDINPLKRLSLGEKEHSSTSAWELSWLNLPILGGVIANV